MKVLELFSATRSIGKAFERQGHEVYSIDWDENFEDTDWCVDIGTITSKDIIERFGIPDVIWASPDCSSYSVAAISHHRRKEEDGNLAPKSEYAKQCDATNQHVIEPIKELNPRFWFIENPRGGMRKMNFMKGLPRYSVSYCQYGDQRMKPTDIWTNHKEPNFKPICKNGDSCHVAAPRGAKTGTQGIKGRVLRALIPEELCDHIVSVCEGSKRKEGEQK